MVIWRNVIKTIIRASLPTIILPAVITGTAIYYFGLTVNSLLAILFLGELYIIWAQLEVALRQTRISMLEYEPEFKIAQEKISGIAGETTNLTFNIQLVNIGNHLARNVLVSIDIGEEHKFMPFTNIAPNEAVHLCTFNKDQFKNSTITIDIDYENVMGEYGGISFVKDPKLPTFIVPKHVRMPGLLLNSFEDLITIFHLFTWSRKAKKLQDLTK